MLVRVKTRAEQKERTKKMNLNSPKLTRNIQHLMRKQTRPRSIKLEHGLLPLLPLAPLHLSQKSIQLRQLCSEMALAERDGRSVVPCVVAFRKRVKLGSIGQKERERFIMYLVRGLRGPCVGGAERRLGVWKYWIQ
jgi:hypothetical protein